MLMTSASFLIKFGSMLLLAAFGAMLSLAMFISMPAAGSADGQLLLSAAAEDDGAAALSPFKGVCFDVFSPPDYALSLGVHEKKSCSYWRRPAYLAVLLPSKPAWRSSFPFPLPPP